MLEQKDKRRELYEKSKELTLAPGVYLMKDASDQILYIGKAKHLKNRVSSYFQSGTHEIGRIELLVQRIDYFDVILTETENEALLLEATLIKKHKPKFNVRLKDDKTYPFLKISLQDEFPKLEITRRVIKDGGRYFGPFPSAWSARQVSQMLIERLKLRECSDNAFRHRSRPCVLYQIGRCTAPCVGKVNREEYGAQIGSAIAVLEGKTRSIVTELKRQMTEAAEAEEFERAAEFRDQWQNLELITEIQGVHDAKGQKDRDVVAVAREGELGHGVLLEVRGGRLLHVKHYQVHGVDPGQSDAELLKEVLAQHYLVQEAGPLPPGEILVSVLPDDHEALQEVVKAKLRTPRGDVDRQLMNVASANAVHALENAKRRNHGHGIEAVEEVKDKLQLDTLPHRIECYDISNFQGTDAVASRVVFVDGAPAKDLYRRYKIRTVEGQNDFAMMKEVLSRRFSHPEEELPQLVLVDGGKGQLAQAVAILEELAVPGVAVAGLAKARTESDFTSQDVKSSSERVFLPGRKNPVMLLPHQASFKLLTHIRDEAHRFAITYHRKLRDRF